MKQNSVFFCNNRQLKIVFLCFFISLIVATSVCENIKEQYEKRVARSDVYGRNNVIYYTKLYADCLKENNNLIDAKKYYRQCFKDAIGPGISTPGQGYDFDQNSIVCACESGNNQYVSGQALQNYKVLHNEDLQEFKAEIEVYKSEKNDYTSLFDTYFFAINHLYNFASILEHCQVEKGTVSNSYEEAYALFNEMITIFLEESAAGEETADLLYNGFIFDENLYNAISEKINKKIEGQANVKLVLRKSDQLKRLLPQTLDPPPVITKSPTVMVAQKPIVTIKETITEKPASKKETKLTSSEKKDNAKAPLSNNADAATSLSTLLKWGVIGGIIVILVIFALSMFSSDEEDDDEE